MAPRSIYPSIPAPSPDIQGILSSVNAMRQTLSMITLNAQDPTANLSASTASQIFVTQAQLKNLVTTGVPGPAGPQGPQGPQGPAAPPGQNGILDAPNDATAYARKSQAWSHITHIDITDWAVAIAGYVPVASTTLPLMDGLVSIGVAFTFARGDHVHPSDTSRLATINPVFDVLPINAANDAAAATAGVPINGMYRNGSVLMVRVA